ncbi:hypothetical protein [Dongia deserti]|uniref:hypothetical protein n=1 Tax=Dongia deserti TaxID=2268030 RepID=UPI0013C51A64|nr:hypothetical protein [Dongia deserti]
MMNRRTFLALGTAAGGAIVLGTALVVDGYRRWVMSVLRDSLPGHSFEPASLARFIDEYESLHDEARKFRLFGAAETLLEARSLLPQRTAERIHNEERQVLTEFLVGSDFFQNRPAGVKTITYNGRAVVCRSPFAVFDL